MRTFFLLSLLLLAFQQSIAQQTFEKYLGNDLNTNDFPKQMVNTPDGGFALVGSTASFGNGMLDIFLIKVDGQGRQQWFRTYGGTHDDEGLTIDLTSDRGFIIGGYSVNPNNNTQEAYVLKVDSLGQESWNRSFNIAGDERIIQVKASTNNTYLVSGNTILSDFTGQDVFIARLNSNGLPIDNQVVASTNLDEVLFMEANANGGFAMAYRTGRVEKIAFFDDQLEETSDIILENAPYELLIPSALTKDLNGQYYLMGRSTVDFASKLIQLSPTGAFNWSQALGFANPTDVLTYEDGGPRIAVFNSSGTNMEIHSLDNTGTILNTSQTRIPTVSEIHKVLLDTFNNPVFLSNTFELGRQSDAKLFALDRLSGQPVVTWTKFLGKPASDDQENSYSVCSSGDGGFVITANRYDERTGPDIWVVKLDSLGKIAWETSLSLSEALDTDEFNWSIELLSDGGFILATIVNNTTYHLTKLNSEGALVWDKAYEFNSGISRARTFAKPLPDGGFIGQLGLFDALRTPTLLRFDAQGDTLWSRRIGTAGSVLTDLEVYGADGFIVSGRKRVDQGGGITTNNAWIARISAVGNIVWENTYAPASNFSRSWDIELTSDNQIISTGYAFQNLGESQAADCLLLKVNINTGLPIWERTYSHEADSSIFIGYHMEERTDGSFINSGFARAFSTNAPSIGTLYSRRILLQRIDANGNELWRKELGEPSQNSISYDGVLTTDNGYFLCGTANNNGSVDVLILRTDAEGNIQQQASRPLALNRARLNITTQKKDKKRVQLRLQVPDVEGLQLKLQNEKGQVMRTWTPEQIAESLEKEIDLSGLQEGNYFLEAQIKKQRVYRILKK